MVKGKRQRANKESPKKITKRIKISSRGTSNMQKDFPVRTLNNGDITKFKELVGLSNNVAGLMKQYNDTELSIIKGAEIAKDILNGKIKGPAMQKITEKLYLPLTDIKGIARNIKSELGILKQANLITKAQLAQRYGEYLDAMKNVTSIFEQELAKLPKTEIGKIRGDRTVKQSKDDEQIIFEKEVSKLTKEDAAYLKAIKSDIDKKAKK